MTREYDPNNIYDPQPGDVFGCEIWEAGNLLCTGRDGDQVEYWILGESGWKESGPWLTSLARWCAKLAYDLPYFDWLCWEKP